MAKAGTRKAQDDYEMHVYKVAHGSAWNTLINSALVLKDMAHNSEGAFTLREVIEVVELIGSKEPFALREHVPDFYHECEQMTFELLFAAVFTLTEDLAVDLSLLIQALEKIDTNGLDEMIEARDEAALVADDAAIEVTARESRARFMAARQ